MRHGRTPRNAAEQLRAPGLSSGNRRGATAASARSSSALVAGDRGLGQPRDIARDQVDLELTVSPPCRSSQVVTWRVCGMSRQSKRLPSTELTVSDVPSRRPSPLAAMKRASVVRRLEARSGSSRRGPRARRSSRAPSTWPLTMWPRQLVADLQRPLEIDPRADVPVRRGGHVERLRRRVDLEDGLAALAAVAATPPSGRCRCRRSSRRSPIVAASSGRRSRSGGRRCAGRWR